jgi:hypothetical protein
VRGFASAAPPSTPPNYVANTPIGGAGSVAIDDPIGLVRVSDSTINVSNAGSTMQNVNLVLDNVTVNHS